MYTYNIYFTKDPDFNWRARQGRWWKVIVLRLLWWKVSHDLWWPNDDFARISRDKARTFLYNSQACTQVSTAPQLFTEPISKKSGAVGSASHVRWSCSKPAVSWGPDNTVTKFLHTWVMVHYSRIVNIHAEWRFRTTDAMTKNTSSRRVKHEPSAYREEVGQLLCALIVTIERPRRDFTYY